MPAPPNMRLTTTAPKSANNSRTYSGSSVARAKRGSMIGGGAVGRRRQLHGFAAAAGRRLVRIVEHELRGELVGLEIHLGAEEKHHRLGIDEDAHALVLDDLVMRAD